MRAKMVYHYPQLPLDNFFFPYSTTLALDYAAKDSASCLYRDPATDELRAHPDLEAVWRDLGRWSLGAYFTQALPMLADTCRVRADEVRV